MLNALIGVGRFNDSKSEEMLSRFLIERRNAVLRRYLPAVNPVVDVRLSPSGRLTFRNAAVDADVARVPAEYVVVWQRFDNATGTTTTLGETRARFVYRRLVPRPGHAQAIWRPPALSIDLEDSSPRRVIFDRAQPCW